MGADYTPTRSERFRQNVERMPPSAEWKPEAFPGYAAPIITSEARDDGVLATFGLLPHLGKARASAQHLQRPQRNSGREAVLP